MEHKPLYSKEIYTTEYRIDWSDQKIIVDCSCGEKELEVFSDSFTYCSSCGRRYSIVELIQVEVTGELEKEVSIDYLDEIGESSWDG